MATWLGDGFDLDQPAPLNDDEEDALGLMNDAGVVDAATVGILGSVLELEGIRHGPGHTLSSSDEGSWMLVVDGHTLTPEALPGTENSINFGHELSGTIFISDGMGGYEEVRFENVNQIVWG